MCYTDRSTVVDNARCLAIQVMFIVESDQLLAVPVQCYLNMCRYDYKLVECSNADYMSPSREKYNDVLHFVICGVVPASKSQLMFSTFRAITSYLEAQVVIYHR